MNNIMTEKYNKERIILMTRLAVYDKNQGAADKRVTDYYLHDYIAKAVFRAVIAVVCGSLIIAFFYVLNLFFNEGVDLMLIDYGGLLRRYGLYTGFIAAGYTVVAAIKATKDHHAAKVRIEEYTRDLKLLDDPGFGKPKKRKKRQRAGVRVNTVRPYGR